MCDMESRRTGMRNSDGEGTGCGCGWGIPAGLNIIEEERAGRGLRVGDVEKLLKCWPVREGISLVENEGFIRATCAGSAALGIGIAGFGSLERSIGCADGLVSMDAVVDPGRGNCTGVSGKFEVERVDWDVFVYRSILEIKVSKNSQVGKIGLSRTFHAPGVESHVGMLLVCLVRCIWKRRCPPHQEGGSFRPAIVASFGARNRSGRPSVWPARTCRQRLVCKSGQRQSTPQ